MKGDEKSRRIRERIGLTIPVRVRGRDASETEWTEMSRLVDVTPFGARLRLSRPTEVGRLLYVTMAMPRSMRCFDHVEDQYRVWSLVRNVKLLTPSDKSKALIEAGVAFVGKYPPAGFLADPSRRYEIAKAQTKSGLWAIRENADQVITEFSETDKRRATRHTIPIEVTIEVFGGEGDSPVREKTVTENISRNGAAVLTSLGLTRGRFVRVTSEQQNCSLVASVRSSRPGPDGVRRLHLEFVGAEWPLEGID